MNADKHVIKFSNDMWFNDIIRHEVIYCVENMKRFDGLIINISNQ